MFSSGEEIGLRNFLVCDDSQADIGNSQGRFFETAKPFFYHYLGRARC